jgi:hypothetical protein
MLVGPNSKATDLLTAGFRIDPARTRATR